MTKCVFCGSEESPYKGVHQIGNDGSMRFYCSSKCRRNALNLKRDRNKLKWTEGYRITKARNAENEKRLEAKAAEKKEEVKETKKQ